MGEYLSIPAAVVLVAALVAAVTDLWTFKVYNLLTLPLLASGLVYHFMRGGVPGLGESLAGLALGFGVLFPFFWLGGMGAGDVKLLAGIGAWLGWPATFLLFLVAALAGGAYALVVILLSGTAGETWLRLRRALGLSRATDRDPAKEDPVAQELACPGRRRRAVPFASMMALGFVLMLAWARWLKIES